MQKSSFCTATANFALFMILAKRKLPIYMDSLLTYFLSFRFITRRVVRFSKNATSFPSGEKAG